MRIAIRATVVLLSLAAFVRLSHAQENQSPEEILAQDLERLQGKWELFHGNEGKGPPTIHSVKEIQGNRETLRRYEVSNGKMTREHSVDFKLTSSGSVRVFTFYAVGGDPKQGQSFVYKVDGESFYDVSGLLQGDAYRNYQESPTIWHWKKVKEGTAPETVKPSVPQPRVEIEPALLKVLEGIGAKVHPKADGYGIDIRRRPGFKDQNIDLIVQCPQVVDLTMEGVLITDKGLEKLRAFPKLSRLILNDCPISSEGLKILAELPLRETLLSIGLRATKVKDDDMTWLKSFPKLERVDVSQTAVTDASLPSLQLLPLKVLNVAGAKLTAAGLEQLQKKSPKLLVTQ